MLVTEHNSEGRLPIHDAAFRNYSTVIDRIIANIISKDDHTSDNIEYKRSPEETKRAYANHRQRIQEMLEAVTSDYYRLTPLLAAVMGDARESIECLINHGAKLTCRDGNNRSIAGITILKQNVDLFLYLTQASYANELDLWNTLMNMFLSKMIDESLAASRMLEQLSSSVNIDLTWSYLSHVHLAEKTIEVFVSTVTENSHEQLTEELVVSCLLIIYNLIHIDSTIRQIFSRNHESTRALVNMRKTDDVSSLLFAHIICHLCDDSNCIRTLVEQNLIEAIQILLNTDKDRLPKSQACLYFDTLSKIARCQIDYQTLIQNASATSTSILEQAIDLLERFDRQLTISVLHFIRDLCLQNEEQQQICAINRLLIAHLLSALNSSYRDVQRSSIDTLQVRR
jgi:hypothetical protein